MKHEFTVTLILILIFLVSQLVGLVLVAKSIEDVTCEVRAGAEECQPLLSDTAIGERPQTQGTGSLVYILVGVALGTVVLLLIAKWGKTNLWRMWFFVAVWVSVAIALRVLIPSAWIAWVVAGLLAVWKLWKPNILIYNLAEVLMYSGIAVLLVPILYIKGQSVEALSVWPALALLIIISVYDIIAVWKSGHMVTMAKFITKSNAFAGLVVPYQTKEKKVTVNLPKTQGETLSSEATHKNAILGGGDITFPLLFSGVVMQSRVVEGVQAGLSFGDSLWAAFTSVIIIALVTTVAIALLFFLAKKDRFYPAMPFVTAGCLLGWFVSTIF